MKKDYFGVMNTERQSVKNFRNWRDEYEDEWLDILERSDGCISDPVNPRLDYKCQYDCCGECGWDCPLFE